MQRATETTQTRTRPRQNNNRRPRPSPNTPPPNTTPAPPLARRRGIQCGVDLAPLRMRNGTPHRPPLPCPPSHRDASLPECRDSGVRSTGLSIQTRWPRPRRDGPLADPSLRSFSTLSAPEPPAPEDRPALSPASRALSRSPRTTGAVRPPCRPPTPPPIRISDSGYSPRSTYRPGPGADFVRFARPRPAPPPAAGPSDSPTR